jgi:hypothetical protein
MNTCTLRDVRFYLSALMAIAACLTPCVGQAADIKSLTFDVTMYSQSGTLQGQWIVTTNGSFDCQLITREAQFFEGRCTGQSVTDGNSSTPKQRISIQRRAGRNNSDGCNYTGNMVRSGVNQLRVNGRFACVGNVTGRWEAQVTPNWN